MHAQQTDTDLRTRAKRISLAPASLVCLRVGQESKRGRSALIKEITIPIEIQNPRNREEIDFHSLLSASN